MNNRTKRINKAIRKIKKNSICESCFGHGTDGAHLLPRNSPQPRYAPDEADNIMLLCRQCHLSYDAEKTFEKRYEWLAERNMISRAKKLKWLYNEED